MTDLATLYKCMKEINNKAPDEKFKHVGKLHIEKLQKEHAATVEIVKNADELQNIIDKFDDSRVHWIEWKDHIVEGDPVHAKCGAIVHDGDHWYSFVAVDSLSQVNCEDCIALPDFNMKLLSETDVGDNPMELMETKDLAKLAIEKGSLGKALKEFNSVKYLNDTFSKNNSGK